MAPEKLGPYRIESEIGRGGMGVVYRAMHADSAKTVAIKVLPAELARDVGFSERFAREINALQKLSHRNIVELIEPGEDQGYQYYVMEFVAGKSLDKLIIAERRFPWQRAVDIGLQICHGLKHAHDNGIIHRDLKPANLLITADDTVKLMDFGIAKVFAGTAITATGGIIGTPEYMSPEQGDSRPITPRSDLYSLGVVMYAMLTGRAPFLGRSMAELLNLHRYGQFDRPIAVVPELPSWLDELVCQLLEKDPEKRPHDAHVVARRLEIVQKKVALRSARTVVEGSATVEVEDEAPRRRRGIGPATLMQRLMRAQLKEMDQPSWIGAIFHKTWVIVLALALAVGTLTLLAINSGSSGEKRRWKEIEKLWQSGDDRDLGSLSEGLHDYLSRYENGPHAEEARRRLPEAEMERRRHDFIRSDAVKDLRPQPEPPSDLERLYRKALLQLWLEGDSAARSTLEQIVGRQDVDDRDRYLVRLAEDDLLSLNLRRAERFRDDCQFAKSRDELEEVLSKCSKSPRHEKWVKQAMKILATLPINHRPPSPEPKDGSDEGRRQ